MASDQAPAPADYEQLDAAALAHREHVLAMLVDQRTERVSSDLRQHNWTGSRATAFVRVAPNGRWFAASGDDQGRGYGFLALLEWLAQIDAARAAGHLATILRSLGALA